MKATALLVAFDAIALAFGFPEFSKPEARQTWTPQEWMPPGPDDGESHKKDEGSRHY
jgi:hypothetical protein